MLQERRDVMTKWIGWIVLFGWILVVLDASAMIVHWLVPGSPAPSEIRNSTLLVCLLLILQKVHGKEQE